MFSRFNFPRRAGSSSLAREGAIDTEASLPTPAQHEGGSHAASTYASLNFNFDFDFAGTIFDFDLFAAPEPIPADHVASLAPDLCFDDAYEIRSNVDILEKLVNDIMEASTVICLSAPQQALIRSRLTYILSPLQTVKAIHAYFECWHPNCSVVHRPTFRIDAIERQLLAAIILLGAMYNVDESERAVAASIADHVESYIFSQSLLCRSADDEIGGSSLHAIEFEVLLAGFLMVATRFWTGSEPIRARAARDTFGQLVKVFNTISSMNKDSVLTYLLLGRKSKRTIASIAYSR